jgi:hypothetical protein
MQYAVNWQPIFKMVEEAPDINIPNDPSTINAAVIQETTEKAEAHVKRRVSYVFNKRKAKPEVWKVGTWSKQIAHSEILKHGTEEDKAQLPEGANYNKPRQTTTRKRKITTNNHVRRRAQRQENPVIEPPAGELPPPPAGELPYLPTAARRPAAPPARPAGELPDVQNHLSEEAQERGRQIEQQVAAEMQTELEQIRNRGRAAVYGDGNVTTFQEREGQERNAGDPDYRGWLSNTLEGG